MSENEPAIIRSVREYVDGLPERFVPEAAAGVTAVYQWEISGEGGATFHAEVVDGACTVSLGAHDSPAVTLCMDAEDWVRLVNGERVSEQDAHRQEEGRGPVHRGLKVASGARRVSAQAAANAMNATDSAHT